MWFWWFLFLRNLLAPCLLIICGWMMWKHCPKEINGVVGYRTKQSMRNRDTWQFANEYCGRLWWKLGWILLLPSALVLVPFYQSGDAMIGIVSGILATVQCIVLIGSVFPVENALRKRFPDML